MDDQSNSQNKSKSDRKQSYLSQAMNKSGIKEGQVIISDGIDIKVRIDFVDMETQKQEYALQEAEKAYHQARKLIQDSKGELMYYKDIAQYLKEQFDKKFEGYWHVIVGKHFGSFISYQSKNVILFWIDDIGFLIYKFG